MKYVVAGVGKFGRLAVERLLSAREATSILVAEKDSEKTRGEGRPGVVVRNSDAVSLLVESRGIASDDVILPMVPFHLAAAYLLAATKGLSETCLPASVVALVPNPVRVDVSTLCCSRADFICPDDCPEGDRCTITGLPRDPLYAHLAELNIPGFQMVVLRSCQILPGLGGYSFGDLLDLGDRIGPGKYVVATSCKCHGIMTAVEKTA